MAQLFREDGKGLRKGPVGTLYVNVYILRVYNCIYIHTYIFRITNKGTEVVARIFQITSLYLQISELNNAKQVTRFVQETGKLMLH